MPPLTIRPYHWFQGQNHTTVWGYDTFGRMSGAILVNDGLLTATPYNWIIIPESRLLSGVTNTTSDVLVPTPEVYVYWTANSEYLCALFVGNDISETLLLTTRDNVEGFITVDYKDEMIDSFTYKVKRLGVTRQLPYDVIDWDLRFDNLCTINLNSYFERFMSNRVVVSDDPKYIPKILQNIDEELDVIGSLEDTANECGVFIEQLIEMEEKSLMKLILGADVRPNTFVRLQKDGTQYNLSRYDYTPAIIDALCYSNNPKLITIAALLPTRLCMLILSSEVANDESRRKFSHTMSILEEQTPIVEINPDSVFITSDGIRLRELFVEKEALLSRTRNGSKVNGISARITKGLPWCPT